MTREEYNRKRFEVSERHDFEENIILYALELSNIQNEYVYSLEQQTQKLQEENDHLKNIIEAFKKTTK